MEKIPRLSDHMSTILSTLKELHINGDHWDVQIQVEDELFRSQRSFLAANSGYFHDEFSGNPDTSNYTRDQPIILENIDATAFEVFYNFIYTNDFHVDSSNILQLLRLNDRLRLCTDHFKNKCFRYVSMKSRSVHGDHTPMHDTLELLDFAHTKKEMAFVDILHAHIGQHLNHFSKEERLMTFSFENLNTLLEFSKNVILPLRGCADVLMNISFNWVHHRLRERSQYLCKLIKNVGFTHLSPGFGVSYAYVLSMAMGDLTKRDYLKVLMDEIPKDIDPTGDDTQLICNAIISLDIPNVKEMQMGQTVSSLPPYTTISLLKWKIDVYRDEYGLWLYLCCCTDDEYLEWCCCANASFIVTSREENVKDFKSAVSYRMFCQNVSYWYACDFLKWDCLVDPKNGYIKNDGSITIKCYVSTDVPFRRM